MITLQQVHLKIQELGKNVDLIDIDNIVNECGGNRVMISQRIESLITLRFVTYGDPDRQKVMLTLTGKLANLPK